MSEPSAKEAKLGEKASRMGVDGKVPNEVKAVVAVLDSMGVENYDSGVVHMALDFLHGYTRDVILEARDLADRREGHKASGGDEKRHGHITIGDAKLAVDLMLSHQFTQPPQREILIDLGRRINKAALPEYSSRSGIPIPPEKYCQTAVNYQLDPLGDTEHIKDVAGLIARSGH
mmetsp:Transcript_3295/g.6437  ORF Transcript_3295/g.6437 Transcript_3295/m.6437 type:complete len:174 (-) Transcript_3295:177-698(-)|eukprot:CAMPEP_0113884392 /NCGR_PEP_ID=MMETSP0780_2-20120614/10239_1 /TAXON_ID=652834 /ORGANISM="Palpitomonas bilix" /LENGTH=173 /DNA_ID=CAMNT_0000872021 /DNA_START=338 /DNA_END=859 /DNA_ORIENTATION=- /assembly_acc=CAM_ASM_000599